MADKRFISADKTIAEIRSKYCKECRRLDGERCQAYECEYEDCIDIIKDTPTADVQEVKHGKWINKTTWFHHIGHIKHECSVCGCIRYGERTDGKGMKYCEECGAKMDLKE